MSWSTSREREKIKNSSYVNINNRSKKLQQQHDDIKKTHKLGITKINKVLSSNTEELFRLQNHNKTLITKIKKLKHSRKKEQSNEYLEGRFL